MYCRAQLPDAGQIKAKTSILQILRMTIQIHDQNVDLGGYDNADHLPVRQNETIPVKPFGTLGIGVEEPDRESAPAGRSRQSRVDNAPREQDMCHRRHSHRSTLVSRIVTSESTV